MNREPRTDPRGTPVFKERKFSNGFQWSDFVPATTSS